MSEQNHSSCFPFPSTPAAPIPGQPSYFPQSHSSPPHLIWQMLNQLLVTLPHPFPPFQSWACPTPTQLLLPLFQAHPLTSHTQLSHFHSNSHLYPDVEAVPCSTALPLTTNTAFPVSLWLYSQLYSPLPSLTHTLSSRCQINSQSHCPIPSLLSQSSSCPTLILTSPAAPIHGLPGY